MGKMSRNKGQRGEREVATLFAAAGWGQANRRSAGEESQLDQGRDLKGTEPYCVQVHLGNSPAPHKKYAEAETAAGGGYPVPLAFTRKTHGRWLVTMSAEEFFRLAGYP